MLELEKESKWTLGDLLAFLKFNLNSQWRNFRIWVSTALVSAGVLFSLVFPGVFPGMLLLSCCSFVAVVWSIHRGFETVRALLEVQKAYAMVLTLGEGEHMTPGGFYRGLVYALEIFSKVRPLPPELGARLDAVLLEVQAQVDLPEGPSAEDPYRNLHGHG